MDEKDKQWLRKQFNEIKRIIAYELYQGIKCCMNCKYFEYWKDDPEAGKCKNRKSRVYYKSKYNRGMVLDPFGGCKYFHPKNLR